MTLYDAKYGKFELMAILVFLGKLTAARTRLISRWPLLTTMSVLSVVSLHKPQVYWAIALMLWLLVVHFEP